MNHNYDKNGVSSTGAKLKLKQLITDSQARMIDDDIIDGEISKINFGNQEDHMVKNFSQKYIQSGMGIVTGTDIMAINHQAVNYDLDEEGRVSPYSKSPHLISNAYSI